MSVVGKLSALKWIEENHPENGLFRVYWKDVINPHDGGATFDENEGEGLRWEWYYKDGKMADGESIGWYPDGKIKQIRRWKDGKEDFTQIWTEYYEDGQKYFEVTPTDGPYYQDGKKVGTWTIWHPNGIKSEVTTWKHGKRHGLYTSWYENGQKKEEKTYKDGKKEGVGTIWYENGQIQEEVEFN
jgi:antitoxin component YwqK of YwqJK toxin-antitoxin module